ncbi:MAG: hypothetical protein K9W44_14775 [Candidatus Lokiarchaeota archaeon]|nr:hypothetical protein [Candidatus Harpocratesius repetitus]
MHPELLDIIRQISRLKSIEKCFVNDWNLNKIPICPFGYYISSIKPSRMIIMANPGKGNIYSYEVELEKQKYEEWKRMGTAKSALDFVKTNQNSLRSWLATGNPYLRNIFHKFWELGIIPKEYPIKSIESYLKYINKQLLNDFIFTDAYKFRYKKDPDKNMHLAILKKEIELCNPKIIISFGGLAWKYLVKVFGKDNLKYYQNSSQITTKITSLKSNLIQHKDGKLLIIPLSHFSPTNSKRDEIIMNLHNLVKNYDARILISKIIED